MCKSKFIRQQKVKCDLFWFVNVELLHSMAYKQYSKCHKALRRREKAELSFGRWSYWATEHFSCRKPFVQSQHWLVWFQCEKIFSTFIFFAELILSFSAKSSTAVFSVWKYLNSLLHRPSNLLWCTSPCAGDTRDVFGFCKSWNEIQSSFSISSKIQLPRPESSLPHFSMHEC